ncbi:hypothetical protein SDC9_72074 [bioreactor metagenome]|uniref:Uncharacterized protein n=1 Tax=bioreactor metagenome TaxID=1076179 RepID=A0A644YCB0_9ZZZZ
MESGQNGGLTFLFNMQIHLKGKLIALQLFQQGFAVGFDDMAVQKGRANKIGGSKPQNTGNVFTAGSVNAIGIGFPGPAIGSYYCGHKRFIGVLTGQVGK